MGQHCIKNLKMAEMIDSIIFKKETNMIYNNNKKRYALNIITQNNEFGLP